MKYTLRKLSVHRRVVLSNHGISIIMTRRFEYYLNQSARRFGAFPKENLDHPLQIYLNQTLPCHKFCPHFHIPTKFLRCPYHNWVHARNARAKKSMPGA